MVVETPCKGMSETPHQVLKLPARLRDLWLEVFSDNWDEDDPGKAHKAAWKAVRTECKEKESRKMATFDQQRVGNWLRTNPELLGEDADAAEKAERGEREANRKAQQARAGRWHIQPKDGGNVTKPGQWASLTDAQFGDPVNYRYPIHDETHQLAAVRYFNHEGMMEDGGYTSAEWAIIGKRIAAKLPGKTYRGGKVVDQMEKAARVEAQPEVEYDVDFGVMQKPYPNEHAARVVDPGAFEPDSFRSKEIAPGIRIILGKRKGGKGGMETQSYRFDASQFSAEEARSWLERHDVKATLEEATEEEDEEKAARMVSDPSSEPPEPEPPKPIPPKPDPLAFVEFKQFQQADGRERWLLTSSGGFEDRDHEVVSTEFLRSCVKSANLTGERGPLLIQHVPGSKIGECDMQVVVGTPGFLVESGTFDDTPDGQRAAAYYREHAKEYGASIKFVYVRRTGDGVYMPPGTIIERSVLPRARAAFPWSAIQLSEVQKMSAENEAREELARVLGTERADEILAQLEVSAKELTAAGVRWKEKSDQPTEVLAAEVEKEQEQQPVEDTAEKEAAPVEPEPERVAPDEEQAKAADAPPAESAATEQSMEIVLPDEVIDSVAQKAFEKVAEKSAEMEKAFGGLAEQVKALQDALQKVVEQVNKLEKSEDERIEDKVRQLPRATIKMIQRPTQTNEAITLTNDPVKDKALLQRGLDALYGKS